MQSNKTSSQDVFEDIEAKIEYKINKLQLLLEIILTMKAYGIHDLITPDLARVYFEELLNRL